ncbi:transposase, partial [Desulfatiferula olefinivorans]
STGPLEGINNKIIILQKQAYGFSDMDFFKLKILALHESKYALIG